MNEGYGVQYDESVQSVQVTQIPVSAFATIHIGGSLCKCCELLLKLKNILSGVFVQSKNKKKIFNFYSQFIFLTTNTTTVSFQDGKAYFPPVTENCTTNSFIL